MDDAESVADRRAARLHRDPGTELDETELRRLRHLNEQVREQTGAAHNGLTRIIRDRIRRG